MKPMRKTVLVVAVGALLGACAGPQTLYSWGGYDAALLAHYKDGSDPVEFAEKMHIVIDRAEGRGGKVAPGLYAELGYAYLEAGQIQLAKEFFRKEHDAWPESRGFVESILARLEKSEDNAAIQGED